MDTVCRFIPSARVPENIQVINFVYESNPDDVLRCATNTVYRIHYVTKGCGKIKCGELVKEVKKDDIFFVFPAVSYEIFSGEDFEYMYMSFIGIRANAELEKLGINRNNFVFSGDDDLCGLWLGSIGLKNETIDLASEGILLYTLSKIGAKYHEKETIQTISGMNS